MVVNGSMSGWAFGGSAKAGDGPGAASFRETPLQSLPGKKGIQLTPRRWCGFCLLALTTGQCWAWTLRGVGHSSLLGTAGNTRCGPRLQRPPGGLGLACGQEVCGEGEDSSLVHTCLSPPLSRDHPTTHLSIGPELPQELGCCFCDILAKSVYDLNR